MKKMMTIMGTALMMGAMGYGTYMVMNNKSVKKLTKNLSSNSK